MYKVFILVSMISCALSASNSANLIMTDFTHYERTATSTTLKDTKLSYDVPTISYLAIRPNYLLLAGLKIMPKQYIGTTYSGATPIKLEQKGWKYELAAAYKYYITDELFIAPALLFSDYYSTLYKTVGSTVLESKSHDIDVRLYGLLGYKLAKGTMMFVGVELDNDVFSDRYKDDYSQYPISITLYQFLSKTWFVSLKYQQTLRDKEEDGNIIGNTDSMNYGFGIGVKF